MTIRIETTIKPKIVTQVEPEKLPKPTSVDLLATISPPPWRPIKAINKPIPAEIAAFRSAGMASMINSRKTWGSSDRILG